MHFHPQKCQTMHITKNVTSSNPPTHHTQPQPRNYRHSQIPRYPYQQHSKLEHSHQQDCTESKHDFSLPPQKHSHMPTQNQTHSLHNTGTSHPITSSIKQPHTKHQVGVGLHVQLRLGGHLTLTSIIQQPHTNTSTSGRCGATRSAEAAWSPHAYKHHRLNTTTRHQTTDRQTDGQTERTVI